MELIANLGKSRATQGLTSENLLKLEETFRNVARDDLELDLDSFKKIIQTKNSFFVERIFHVFDANNSGTVSLEEFMQMMRCLAKQSSTEKLQCLFDLYDLNNDGHIEFDELRNVISECMKENGLKFEEAEIDELTRMLFEDADTDSSGTITFTEFKDQLEKQPAFMENLTNSIERWFLPPMEVKSSKFNVLSQWRRRWQRVRNNWTSAAFMSLYFLINVGLFGSRAWEYRTENAFVIAARACGQCLNFNCTFVGLLVLRTSLTWLRTHGFAQYFPIDQHLYYHKLTGCVILLYSLLHTVMHVINFYLRSEISNIPLHVFLTSTDLNIGWVNGSACLTGWIILAVLIIIVASAMPFVRRTGKFEVFYYLHLLSVMFWICLLIHSPNFWKWALGPGFLFLIEIVIRFNRNLSNSKLAYIQQGILLPSKVTHLVIKRPPKFEYKPGDYVYVNIPAIAHFEWHPFTISSAPELNDVIWLHIRGVGEWTNSLHGYFEKEDREAVLSEELAKNLGLSSEVRNCLNKDCASLSSVSPCGEMPCSLQIPKDHSSAFVPENDIAKFKSINSDFRYALEEMNKSAHSDDSASVTVIEMEQPCRTYSISGRESLGSTSLSVYSSSNTKWRRTSFTSASLNYAVHRKNKEDIRSILAEHGKRAELNTSRLSLKIGPREKRKSVRVSIAKRGLRRCQTVIVMPTVNEDDENEVEVEDKKSSAEEIQVLEKEMEAENVIVRQTPLKIFLDGPYGSPSRHIFQAKHAVLIATGIGVTPFASILQSIVFQFRKSRHTCPSCNHKWSDPNLVTRMHLQKVDFFWLNRHQRAFEWFVNLLSELEIEQAQLVEKDRFLDIHMYITSALRSTDMKAVGLQMALDLLYQKEKRCLITGLKSRTQPGRPDWDKVFTSLADQKKGKVTVFFCGPNQLAKEIHLKCDQFGFKFRKEIF